MAISKFFNICSGSLGNLVFYTRRGNTYIRTKPLVVNNPKTPAQQAQRQRMKLMMEFLRKFTEPIRITYASVARYNKIPFQAALSYNLLNAITGEYPDQRIDKSKVLLSRGRLPISTPFSLKLHPEGFLVEWELSYEEGYASYNDMLMVIVLFKDEPLCRFELTQAYRSHRQYLWKSRQPLSPEELPDVWVAFRDYGMTQVSNSLKLEWQTP